LVRTDSQEEQSFEVGEAGDKDGSVRRDPGRPGPSGACTAKKREFIARGGTRRLRFRVWESEKPRVIRTRKTRLRRGWITAREQCGPGRGARFLWGERSEGRYPGTVVALIGCENELARKPLGGNPVFGLD